MNAETRKPVSEGVNVGATRAGKTALSALVDGQEPDRPGLRKSAATRVAEASATEARLLAHFGWSDLAMARHHAKLASAKKLAIGGAAKVVAATSVVIDMLRPNFEGPRTLPHFAGREFKRRRFESKILEIARA